MYSGRSYLIDVRVNGKWLMTCRVTEKAILNKMNRDSKTFEQSRYGLFTSQFNIGSKKSELHARAYQKEAVRACLDNGSSKFEDITYELTESETTGMMARSHAREFIR